MGQRLVNMSTYYTYYSQCIYTMHTVHNVHVYTYMYMYMYIIHILYMYNVHAHSMCTIYLFTLHQFLLGHVEVKLDVETLHKLSDGVSIGIGLLWSGNTQCTCMYM